MIQPRVYVETTIPSFYHDARSAPAIVARREWTRQWWSDASTLYELVTSLAVVDELSGGPPDRNPPWLELIRDLPLLLVEPAVADIVQTYIQHKLMPGDPSGDALHLALASYHKCDFVVTWNCQHLANANKFGHIRRVNTNAWTLCARDRDPVGIAWRIPMKTNQSDPVIDEIREIRHRISERFDHDPARLVAYYIEMQKEYQDRLIGAAKAGDHKDPSTA